ncbi:BnaC03g35100D [Brassica napus]|uniref:RNA helicase n=1 Tax=Brassica napus TaxID=3708 RepID=A0A078F8F4_BRANA|nr:BnaC03g35100D [Brassica napus]
MMMKKKSERRNLPVWGQKEEFLRTFKENQMVMVTGETGSGKTTQIPQFVLEAMMDEIPSSDDQLLVGCTQPHRVATTRKSASYRHSSLSEGRPKTTSSRIFREMSIRRSSGLGNNRTSTSCRKLPRKRILGKFIATSPR